MGPDLSKECGASGPQVLALGVGVNRQIDRRIMAVPGGHDMHRQTGGQHQAHAGVAKTLEVDAAQAGAFA